MSLTRIAGDSVVQADQTPVTELVGKTVRYAMPDGEYIEREYVSETSARWQLLTGPHKGEGGTEQVSMTRVGPAVFFVNRVDPIDGETISEVYNLRTQTVSIYVTRADPDDPLRRVEKSRTGRVEILGPGQAQVDAIAPAGSAASS
ncbi:MAG: MoaF N-terminal domain-containing protein [Nevskiales bacterium]|nr:MoaF N-terminal domain-containing protein [Nevskiales bacterium]